MAKINRIVRRFFVVASSEGCKDVQSAVVEVQAEIRGAPIWLVHGVFKSIGIHWNDASFRTYIRELFGYDYYTPRWNSIPGQFFISQGARAIAQQIKQWRIRPENQGVPLILIGYSHGGNVNKEIVNILAREDPPIFVNTLINIGTPIRPDFTLNARVGQHINVFNARDAIQVIGSGHTITVEAFDPDTGTDETMQIRTFSIDPRNFEGAINIIVPSDYHPRRVLRNHDFMHADREIWHTRIRPCLILPPPTQR